ncbi:MAG: hypothetical protein Q7T34_01545 [Candidatus Parcubacteria bacterium]|nr:hypothetical protein [Candidatus Parcubacteria bacterium]
MNKNIIIGIIATVIILAGVFFILNNKGPIDTALFEGDETELTSLGNDINAFNQDETILDEINQTFSDILDESAVVSVESALDLTSIEKEAAEADFAGELDVFNEAILQEIDQALGETL